MRAGILLAALSFAAPEVAHAAQVVQAQNFAISSTLVETAADLFPGSTTGQVSYDKKDQGGSVLTFSPFDFSLGILTQASLTLTSQVTLETGITIATPPGAGGGAGTAGGIYTYSVTLGGVELDSQLTAYAASCFPTSDACINVEGPFTSSYNLTSPGSDLYLFTGDFNVPLDLAFTHELTGIIGVLGRPLSTITVASGFSWAGTATVTYDYIPRDLPPPPPAVPELGTWAMLICGLGCAGGLARRRHAAQMI